MPTRKFAPFGSQLPHCEPYWYQGYPSAYYTENHVAFRKKVRDFVEKEMKPYADQWIRDPKGYPKELHQKAFDAGILGIIYPKELGGYRPPDFDAFYELIMLDEMARLGGGAILGQAAINSMALPPVVAAGSEEMKREVVKDVVQGRKFICLAISEPEAGSDVSNLKTTAERQGDFYIVNGSKKWITGGTMADYFTLAVRTGSEEDGPAGLSLLLVDRHCPGIKVRKMETQFDTAHSTTFITFEDVKVPVSRLIGEEGAAFQLLLLNFNHERFVIAAAAARQARMCYEESLKYSVQRETFGKKLAQHQVIRMKLAEMARQVEALQDHLERIAFLFSSGVPDHRLGSQCALLKVTASRTLEFCAREASQVFGGSALVKEGKGKLIERIYREVRAAAIPGGSEEILLDLAARQAVAKAAKERAKGNARM